MRRYLATLHTRSDKHKKHFALGVSGGFTLLMFAIWLSVNYKPEPIVATDTRPQLAAAHEVGPLESVSNFFSSIKDELASLISNGR